MTIQISDRIILDDEEHLISSISLEKCPWPNVRKHISSVQKFSACWRGYHSKWLIENDMLFLSDLTIMWSGRNEWLTFFELFPDAHNGVDAYWFSGEIEIPKGNNLDLGHDYWMHEESLILSISNGTLIKKTVRDNRQKAAEKADQINHLYSRPIKITAEQSLQKLREIEAQENVKSPIEAGCDEFMFAALMGAADSEMMDEWEKFYKLSIKSATPEERLLLDVVKNAVEHSAREGKNP